MKLTLLKALGGIAPDWPAPPNVRAWSSVRQGGVSAVPYGTWQHGQAQSGGLNVGTHVGDDPVAVAQNRLCVQAHLPNAPHWLNQVHGTTVWEATAASAQSQQIPTADASFSTEAGQVCAVMTADCLPVLLCDTAGQGVAAAHAGWRGLVAGVLEQTVLQLCAQLETSPNHIMAWLGPAIGPQHFEVGAEVRTAFWKAALPHEQRAVEAAFSQRQAAQGCGEKYLADIFALARIRLLRSGITQIYGGDICTVSDPQRFYSYRRDGVTGRMVTLVWLAADSAG